jgi:hypothetical protein
LFAVPAAGAFPVNARDCAFAQSRHRALCLLLASAGAGREPAPYALLSRAGRSPAPPPHKSTVLPRFAAMRPRAAQPVFRPHSSPSTLLSPLLLLSSDDTPCPVKKVKFLK